VAVSPSLRAVFFAAQSILSGDAEIAVIILADEESYLALLLASPDAIGRWNLLPRARLAVRSLTGVDSALQVAGIAPDDIHVIKDNALSISDLLDELEDKSARWGMVSTGRLALLMERI
jgi:hypothetical protein